MRKFFIYIAIRLAKSRMYFIIDCMAEHPADKYWYERFYEVVACLNEYMDEYEEILSDERS